MSQLTFLWTTFLRPLNLLVTATNTLGNWSYLVLFIIIFLESAFLAFAFLPGQSLLFLSSSIAANATSLLNIWLLLLVFITAATSGAMLKYRETQRLTRNGHFQAQLHSSQLESTQALFDRHEKPSLLWGRFIPLLGLFIPVIAGTTRMDWRRFELWNFLGVLTWVGACCFGGYYFGDWPVVQEHFTVIMISLIIIPLISHRSYDYLRQRHLRTNHSA